MLFKTFSAFLLRDLRQALSYRFAFVLDVASVFFSSATFYFVAKMFDAARLPAVDAMPGGFFPFVLIGIAFSTYQSVGLNSFAQSLRQEQFIGTMESILATPVRIPVFLAGSALWDFLYATLEVLTYFIVAILIFGLAFHNINILMVILAVLLTLTTFMGLGILSAAFILRFKRGNPVTWVLASAGELFGGVYFPISILPDWMRSISEWMPMTHALNALRQSLGWGSGWDKIGPDIIFLFCFTLVVWPVGILAFQWALKRSQVDGSLSHY